MTGWYWLALAPVAALATVAFAGLLRMTPLPVTKPHKGGHLAPLPDRLATSWHWWRNNWRAPQLRACAAADSARPDQAGPAPVPASGAGPLARETRPQPVLDRVPLTRPWSPENTWTGAGQ